MSSGLPHPFTADLKVLVLAGSNPVSERRRRSREQRRQRGETEVPLENKAFLTLRSRLVIEYVLDWLEECGLHRIWVLAPDESLARIPDSYHFEPLPQAPGSTIVTNLTSAYDAVQPAADEPVLVVFGDHPLNTPAALDDFLSEAAGMLDQADYFHGIALRSAYRDFRPYSDRTSVHMREMSGRVSGLNLAVPSRLHRLKVLDEMYAIRKLERFGSFVGLLGRLIHLLGRRSPMALVDALVLYLAKELQKVARRGGLIGRVAEGAEEWLARRVRAQRMQSYGTQILKAERGVRLVPLHHGGIAIDVDFREELHTLESNWDDLRRIAERQAHSTTAGQRRRRPSIGAQRSATVTRRPKPAAR